MEEKNHNSSSEDLIDLKELTNIILGKKGLITVLVFLFTLGSIVYSLVISEEYTATAVVSEGQYEGTGSLSNLGRSTGFGLPSISSFSFGGAQTSHEANMALEIMKSWEFIDGFIKENELEIPLLAVKDWNENTNQLVIDQTKYDSTLKKIKEPKLRNSTQFTWELFKEFESRLQVSLNNSNQLIYVSIEFYSPIVAQEWVEKFIYAINKKMQERKLIILNRNIENLEKQLLKTREVLLKEKLFSILAIQIKEKSLAEASPEYAFVTVNKAMVPEVRSFPRRTVIVIGATFLGAFLSILWVLLNHYFILPRKNSD